MDKTKQPGIRIQQIFLERASFSHRPDSLTLPHTTAPEVGELKIDVQAGVAKGGGQGILRVRVRTQPSQKPLYVLDVTMTALVGLLDTDVPNMTIEEYIGRYGPGMLYPFVRQAVSEITIKGRFGPIWLNPFNFLAGSEAPLLQRTVKSSKRKLLRP